jgi:UDP-glucose 4-epimerase
MLAAKKAGVDKVVFASSSSVYGNQKKLPISEESPLRPENIYGATKLAAEKYCLTLGQLFGINTVCLRYFSVYGPRGRPDQVLYSFASRIAKNERPIIYGDGLQTRDFTFVSDVVDATVLASLFDEANGQVMNIGYGKEINILYAAKKIMEYFDSKVDIDFRKEYKGDFLRTLADNRVARSILAWKPQFAFETGIQEFLKWFTSERKVA